MSWASLIPTALKIVYRLIKYFTSKNYRDEKKREKKRKEREKLHEAVKNGDTGEVNRRVRRILKVLPIAFLLTVGGCVGNSGGEVMYIAEEEKVVRMEHKGESGWWVPDAVMFKLIDEAETENGKQGDE